MLNNKIEEYFGELVDFKQFIKEYGHIYYFDNDDIKEPFENIINAINKIKEINNGHKHN